MNHHIDTKQFDEFLDGYFKGFISLVETSALAQKSLLDQYVLSVRQYADASRNSFKTVFNNKEK